MTPFDYLSVLISIVLGLSMTQLLGGFAGLVRGRGRIDFYWPLPVQMFGLFLINTQVWWAMFGLRREQHWTFAGFVVVLLQPVTLYLMSAIITPDAAKEGERIDLRAFYFREKNWFFGASLATIIVSLIKDIFVISGAVAPADLVAHGIFATMSVTGIVSNGDGVQKALAPLLLLFVSVYIALLFLTLPR